MGVISCRTQQAPSVFGTYAVSYNDEDTTDMKGSARAKYHVNHKINFLRSTLNLASEAANCERNMITRNNGLSCDFSNPLSIWVRLECEVEKFHKRATFNQRSQRSIISAPKRRPNCISYPFQVRCLPSSLTPG